MSNMQNDIMQFERNQASKWHLGRQLKAVIMCWLYIWNSKLGHQCIKNCVTRPNMDRKGLLLEFSLRKWLHCQESNVWMQYLGDLTNHHLYQGFKSAPWFILSLIFFFFFHCCPIMVWNTRVDLKKSPEKLYILMVILEL